MILASEALLQLKLTRLLWMLTPISPHKQNQFITPVAHRLEMVQAAIRDVPRFELSTIEFERPAPQYTVDTLHILQKQNPSSDLILLLGADSLRGLATWHRPVDLVAACHQIGVMRSGRSQPEGKSPLCGNTTAPDLLAGNSPPHRRWT
jgi:nicotinate-nucleotide adenylyltransferase